jgi:outer membrane protein assembly factor BamB
VRDERTLWKLELPSSAPLEVHPGEPPATIAAGRVYATYNRTSTRAFTVVAVTLSSGERLWETAVPRSSYASLALRASDRHVFARAETSLYALSATDGRVLWRMGWDPGAD